MIWTYFVVDGLNVWPLWHKRTLDGQKSCVAKYVGTNLFRLSQNAMSIEFSGRKVFDAEILQKSRDARTRPGEPTFHSTTTIQE